MAPHDPIQPPASPANMATPLELITVLPTVPPASRLRLLVPGLLAFLLIGVLIAVAIASLRQRPEGYHSPSSVVQVLALARKARIEAPFAPKTLRPLSAEQAVAWNAARPATVGTTDAASAFLLRSGTVTDYQRSLQCLTMAIYYEAGSESDDGERAVAQVILNRLRHPAYPKTVCGVVLDGAQRRTGCQFTFACDGSLARTPSGTGWTRATRIATAALGGLVYAPVGWATHYHANYVVPYWAASLDKVTVIGAHIFYRWSGVVGQRSAFRGVYAGNEPALTLPVITDMLTGATGSGEASLAGKPTAVATTERPVLTGVGPSDATSPVAAIGLGERRILPRAPDPGDINVSNPTAK